MYKWDNKNLDITEARISEAADYVNGVLGNIGTRITIDGVVYGEAVLFRKGGKDFWHAIFDGIPFSAVRWN